MSKLCCRISANWIFFSPGACLCCGALAFDSLVSFLSVSFVLIRSGCPDLNSSSIKWGKTNTFISFRRKCCHIHRTATAVFWWQQRLRRRSSFYFSVWVLLAKLKALTHSQLIFVYIDYKQSWESYSTPVHHNDLVAHEPSPFWSSAQFVLVSCAGRLGIKPEAVIRRILFLFMSSSNSCWHQAAFLPCLVDE